VNGRLLLNPDTKAMLMKTMTCRQLGGPCDFAHHGEDANQVIKAQDRHLREAVASGATDHEAALTAMKAVGSAPSPACGGIAKHNVTSPRYPTDPRASRGPRNRLGALWWCAT